MSREKFQGIRGRGASTNPKNRFETLEVVPDYEDLDPEEPEPEKPETIYLKDHARSIVTPNDSPDIGFDAGISPYRGCSHGCSYCLTGDTPILMGDGTTRSLKDVRVGDEIYGTVRRGNYRRYTKTRVLDHWRVRKPAYRVILADGTSLVCGGDHRFLTERGWKFVTGTIQGDERRPYLTTKNKLMGIGRFAQPPEKDDDYKKGYLCGIIRGDAHLGSYAYPREGGRFWNVYRFRLALTDLDALRHSGEYLLGFGVATRNFLFQEAIDGRMAMHAIRTSSQGHFELIQEIVAWPSYPSVSWRKGFLAGIFDTEGGYRDNTLRIHNTDLEIIDRVVHCLKHSGFVFEVETVSKNRVRPMKVVRVCGGLKEHLRFFHTFDPAISRKRDIEGTAIKSDANLAVKEIQPLGTETLFDITTGTGDFIADGVVSHNCFSRPNHEYRGFSAGLDFETKILVKENAPDLLRKKLFSPRWEPKPLAMSGSTDVYQPVEKKLELTRRCLEVLVEFRNPVVIITKNHLVTRDMDLLSELARYDAVSVNISLTTLDDDLRRVMEPRTSSPRRRLDAIEKLADSGVLVGVLTAPIIPGLNDHELPNLLQSAADAGAKFAGYTPVRLPYAVAALFEDWLERHFPDRKEKVLNHIREMRGGKLNDPRFGSRMGGEGVYAEHLARLFQVSCKRAGISTGRSPALSIAAFRRSGQPTLFD